MLQKPTDFSIDNIFAPQYQSNTVMSEVSDMPETLPQLQPPEQMKEEKSESEDIELARQVT